jgi:hypothetical protein
MFWSPAGANQAQSGIARNIKKEKHQIGLSPIAG